MASSSWTSQEARLSSSVAVTTGGCSGGSTQSPAGNAMPLMPAPSTHPVQEWLTQNGKTIEASLQEADSKIRLLMRQVSSWQDWSDELKAFQALNAQGSLVPTPRSVEDEDEDSWGAWGPQGLGTASVTRARNDPPANVAIPLKEAGPRLENSNNNTKEK